MTLQFFFFNWWPKCFSPPLDAPKNTSAHVTGSGFVVEGRSVTLSCSSDANPPVLNYTWYRDTEEPLKPVQSGQNLTISNTDPTHSGRYVCTAQNEHGTQNASVTLDVQCEYRESLLYTYTHIYIRSIWNIAYNLFYMQRERGIV